MELFNVYDEKHKAHILRLAIKNQFYTDDLLCALYGKIPSKVRRQLNPEQLSKLEEHAKKEMWGKGYGGYMTEHSFMLTYTRQDNIGIDLLFLLVDKEERGKGLGTQLLQKLTKVVVVKVEPGMEAWYKKYGFTENHIYRKWDEMCNPPSPYQKLYFGKP